MKLLFNRNIICGTSACQVLTRGVYPHLGGGDVCRDTEVWNPEILDLTLQEHLADALIESLAWEKQPIKYIHK